MSHFLRASCAISALVIIGPSAAFAQSTTQLPTITVTDNAGQGGEAAPSSSRAVVTVTPGGILTILTAEQARGEIQRTPGANTFMADPYAIWGMKTGYDNDRNFYVYVEARNLSDKAYISSASVARTANASSAVFEPGTGRAIHAGAKLKS